MTINKQTIQINHGSFHSTRVSLVHQIQFRLRTHKCILIWRLDRTANGPEHANRLVLDSDKAKHDSAGPLTER